MEKLADAARAHREAEEAVARTRAALAAAIIREVQAGAKQGDIVDVTGYTRERVRQICRAAGIKPTE